MRKINSIATHHLPHQLSHHALLGRKARGLVGVCKHRQEQADAVVVFVFVVVDDDGVVGVASDGAGTKRHVVRVLHRCR